MYTDTKLTGTQKQSQVFSARPYSYPVNYILHTGSIKKICPNSAWSIHWIIYWVVLSDFYSSPINHSFNYQRKCRVFNHCLLRLYNKEDQLTSGTIYMRRVWKAMGMVEPEMKPVLWLYYVLLCLIYFSRFSLGVFHGMNFTWCLNMPKCFMWGWQNLTEFVVS